TNRMTTKPGSQIKALMGKLFHRTPHRDVNSKIASEKIARTAKKAVAIKAVEERKNPLNSELPRAEMLNGIAESIPKAEKLPMVKRERTLQISKLIQLPQGAGAPSVFCCSSRVCENSKNRKMHV